MSRCVCLLCCKHREGRLKQEMENMTQQNEWLNSELQEKIQELMNSRKEKVVKVTRNNDDNSD